MLRGNEGSKLVKNRKKLEIVLIYSFFCFKGDFLSLAYGLVKKKKILFRGARREGRGLVE